jgi:chromosome segregation ATPase
MITRLAKIPELEKSNATLFKEKADLLEQVGKLSIELKEVKDNCVKINKELATLTDKLGKVQKENDVLKMENSNIVSNQTELKARSDEADQAVRTASLLKSENVQLKTMLAELRGNQTAPVSGEVSTTGEDKAILEEKVRTLEEQEIMLKKALEEWTELAKVCAHNDRMEKC